MSPTDTETPGEQADAARDAQENAGWKARSRPVAAPESAPAAEAHKTSSAESFMRGFRQGGTLGFGDELSGAMQAIGEKTAPYNPMVLAAHLSTGRPLGELYQRYNESRARPAGDIYRENRDSERAADVAAKASHPGIYGGANILGGAATTLGGAKVLAPAIGEAPTLLGRMARAAAFGGPLAAATRLGQSNVDLSTGDRENAKSVLADMAKQGGLGAAISAAIPAVGSAIGAGTNAIANRAASGVRLAEADAAQAANSAAQKGLASARGGLGGDTADVLNKYRSMTEALQNPASTVAQKTAAQAQLSNPEFQKVYRQALDNLLELGPEKLGGRLANSRAALETARQAASPEAVQSAAEQSLANPIKTQVVPRLAHMANKMIPPAIGMPLGAGVAHFLGLPPSMGAALGSGAGAVMSSVMGNPGRTIANMVQSPAVRKAAWDTVQKLATLDPGSLGRWGAALANALRRNPDEAMAIHEAAFAGNPEYQNKVVRNMPGGPPANAMAIAGKP